MMFYPHPQTSVNIITECPKVPPKNPVSALNGLCRLRDAF
jgi:hypothetical protein